MRNMHTYLKNVTNEKIQVIARRKLKRSLKQNELSKIHNRLDRKISIIINDASDEISDMLKEFINDNFSD